MSKIKAMIERLIALRDEGVDVTLLAVCPNSDAVLEAAVQAAARNDAPMFFAATLNQVDRDGGYTGWTPAQFVARMRQYAQKYACHEDLYPCLDHGGQWLKDAHTRDKLSLAQTTAEVKASITAMLEAGYALLHIDPTVDRTQEGPLAVETVVARSLDLIAHAERERERLGLPPVAYEVGTEEVHGGLVALESFERFLALLHQGLAERGLLRAWPAFVVAQVGTDLHTTTFDAAAAEALYRVAAPYGSLVKGHYTDWVENPQAYPLAGMGGANVGPEFTATEYDALAHLEAHERRMVAAHSSSMQPSGFLAALETAVERSNRWQKWLQPDERGRALTELSPERRTWLVKTGARYVWAQADVVAARERLYANLRPWMGEPHQFVVDWITRAIEAYIVAFHLYGARRLFEGAGTFF